MGRIVGAQAVILDDQGRVLLQMRSWPPGWEPPGGHVGRGEDPAETVVRETQEECGLRIEIERLVGHYRFRGIRMGTDAVYRAHPVGGELRSTKEALLLRWAEPDNLPLATFPWYRQRIADAVRPQLTPVLRSQTVTLTQVLGHGLALAQELGEVGMRRLGLRS